jgi:hypothetical protein
MAASGNVRYSQLRSGDRSGTGTKVGTVTGALTTAKQLQFSSGGDIEASAFAVGGVAGSAIAPSITTPVNGDFSWRNQGPATVTVESTGSIYLEEADGVWEGTATDIRIRKKAAPSTPYTITAAFLLNLAYHNFSFGGLCWTDGTKVSLWCKEGTGNFSWRQYADANNGASGGTYFQTGITNAYTGPLLWMQISDDGTDRIVRIGPDGQHWRKISSVTRTDYLTPTEVGFFVQAGDSGSGAGITLVSWAQT